MTANESLLDSCGIIFSDQGISLHYNAQNNTAIDQTFQEKRKNNSYYHYGIEHESNHILLFTNLHNSVLLVSSRSFQLSTSNKIFYFIALLSPEVTVKFCRVPFLLYILLP